MIMPDKETEKIIGGAVDIALAEEFDKQVFGRRFTKKKLFKAFAKWWIGLPGDEQKRFYSQADEDIELFSEWLIRLIEEHIETILSKPISTSRKRKPPTEAEIRQSLDNIKYFVTYKLPSPEEWKALDELRRLLEPKKPAKKKRTRRA